MRFRVPGTRNYPSSMPRSRVRGARCWTRGAAWQRGTGALLGLVAAACTNGTVGPSSSSVDTVVVVPAVATVSLGASITLQAEARDAGGNLLSREAFWSAADSAIATVTSDGLVTARRLGQVQIAASVEGKSGLSSVTVTRTPVATVRLLPANASLTVGGSITFTVETRDAGGTILTGRPVIWISSNPAVATVTAGRATALAAGASIISAESEGHSGLASVNVSGPTNLPTVTVTPATATIGLNQTVQLTAVYRNASGQAVDKSFSWSTANSHVATVSSKGKVTGRGPGTVSIRATASGITGTASITVR